MTESNEPPAEPTVRTPPWTRSVGRTVPLTPKSIPATVRL